MSKIEEMFQNSFFDHEIWKMDAIAKEIEHEQFQKFEDIILEIQSKDHTVSLNAISKFNNLSEEDKKYMLTKHINYTQFPVELYKFFLDYWFVLVKHL